MLQKQGQLHAAKGKTNLGSALAKETGSFISKALLNELDLHDAAQYVVNVTNTGSVDSDHVVLGFLTPPGAGQNGVPLQTLFGFERVHVKAGESVSVWLYPSVSAFAQPSALDGVLTPHPGAYKIRFGLASGHKHGMGFAELDVLVE